MFFDFQSYYFAPAQHVPQRKQKKYSRNKTVNKFVNTFAANYSDAPEEIFVKLAQVIHQSGCKNISFEPLSGALGFCSSEQCVLSTSILRYSFAGAIYIILHELAHQLQYKKYGDDLMQQCYFDECDITVASEFLKHIETIADRYAIAKTRQILNNTKYSTTVRYISPGYKSISARMLELHINRLRDYIKEHNFKDIKQINQFLYNQLKNINKPV